MTDNARSEISFSGSESEDATLFIQQVQKVAFAEGRHWDNGWRVRYLATCLTGAAVRWYFLLDDDKIRDTAALSSMRPSSYPDVSGVGPALRGRLKIHCSGEFIGYLAREMSMLDRHQEYPKNIEEALIVQIPSEDRQRYARWNIELINPIPWDPECKYLGIVDRDDTSGKKTFLVQCSSDGPSTSSECATARAWGFHEGQELCAARTAEDHSLMVLHPCSNWRSGSYRLEFKEYPFDTLIFEPI
ncbi:hypothetical protein FRB95_002361 [Tulasnella sp. JGI-2019a]|nr:hypothetical protein FRB93_010984 [Tulasnella sp. JGI-2019a]KAG9031756.1 hypothetical protein FRB95_002361 [Tulasnella sp. JGI-2019a]